ncbi:POTRA domain-containing protein, partial [Ancylomarina sp.]|uniref:POTRA domain-containing protein n=1 Tax=Ancylomarina sp. TaxID=1970196 RepID=UPI0035623F96
MSGLAQNDLIVRKITFSGNDSLSQESLLKQMNTRPPSFSKKLSFWNKRIRFSSFTFEEDILKLKKYYQKNGFLKPVITYQLEPATNGKKLDIAIKIKEGSAVLTGKVILNLPNNVNGQPSLDSLRKLVQLETKHRFRDEDVIATEKMIYDNFSSKGYPYIRVTTDITLSLDKLSAEVAYGIIPGQKSYIGTIDLEGDSLISRSYINKNIKLKENEIFTQTQLEQTQEKLFDLGLFQYVIIRANMDGVENDRIPI